MNHKAHFGFKKEPFAKDIETKDLLVLPSMSGVAARLNYNLNLGGVVTIFGEVGSGKTTSLRWALSKYHPQDVKVIDVIASTGSITELYKQLARGLDLVPQSSSRATLLNSVKSAIRDLAVNGKQRILVSIDEAQLLRREVLAELHTVLNFDHDGTTYMTLVLCGTPSLIENLQYRGAAPLASRVTSKAVVSALSQGELEEYLFHHLKVAGIKTKLFDATAINAIYQGCGGSLRRTNLLGSGSLLAAALEKCQTVTSEHVRTAASELIM